MHRLVKLTEQLKTVEGAEDVVRKTDAQTALAMVPSKVGCGHQNYNQKTNFTMIRWAELANISISAKGQPYRVLVDQPWFMQGKAADLVKFCNLLATVPIATTVLDARTGGWVPGTCKDLYMCVSRASQYNIHTPPGKVLSEQIQKMVFNACKPGIPLIEELPRLKGLLGLAVDNLLGASAATTPGESLKSFFYEKVVKKKVDKLQDAILKFGYKTWKGWEKSADVEKALEKQIAAGKGLVKTYNMVKAGKPDTRNLLIVELSCFSPPYRVDDSSRRIIRFNVAKMALGDIGRALQDFK